MKKIKYYLLFAVITSLTFTSCLVDQDAMIDTFDDGPNVVGFATTAVTAPVEVPGEPVPFETIIRLEGPTVASMTEPVTVTIAVIDSSTTAVEGTNYTLETNTFTLTPENDYSAPIPITVNTAGILPPEVVTLAFEITEVSGAENVVISGKQGFIDIDLSYICFADLSGTYTMTNSVCDPQVEGVTITKNEDGSWQLSTADGGLLQYCTANTGLVNSGSIIVVCGEVLASSNLDYCGLGIGCITGGTWNSETGVLELTHSDTFFGVGSYSSTYTRTSTSTE